jgi:hypothetical protein
MGKMSRPAAGLIGHPRVWIEITKSEHQHGGPGWEFGTCLWSPTLNATEKAAYAIMLEPRRGDEVLHFYEDKWPDEITDLRFCGWSRVSATVEIRGEPPIPGGWAGREAYYRIPLQDFTWTRRPVGISRFLHDYDDALTPDLVDKPKFYPFYRYGPAGPLRLVQGGYLTKATDLLRQLLFYAAAETPPDDGIPDGAPNDDFAEGRRKSREMFFFARNRRLTERARALHGTKCIACKFDFEKEYGDVGRGYIECHHLDPLSERSDRFWTDDMVTNVHRVAMVCANCHRMIHRRRPAYTLEDIIAFREAAVN